MKLFARRQSDPLSARTQALSKEIARLEAEIAVLADKKTEPKAKASVPTAPSTSPASLSSLPLNESEPASIGTTQNPSLQRSTTSQPKPNANRPKRIALASIAAPEIAPAGVRQPIATPPQPTPNDPHFNDLGVRKYDLLSAWRRLTHHLSGPTSNNPKMVHYLAAGSIQGLRPLRYERRVARNRFLAFLALLLLVLWGLAYWSFKR